MKKSCFSGSQNVAIPEQAEAGRLVLQKQQEAIRRLERMNAEELLKTEIAAEALQNGSTILTTRDSTMADWLIRRTASQRMPAVSA